MRLPSLLGVFPRGLCVAGYGLRRGVPTWSPIRAMSGSLASSPTLTPCPQPGPDGPMYRLDRPIRNIAVIAHVDHGKTSLVDQLLKACVDSSQLVGSMDSNPLEKERGITILSKVTSLEFGGHVINVVDTPGHADFGGEVERVLSMVDGVLLVVCATEGVMPQTKYVLSKAIARGLPAIVVLNKCDREGARLGLVENEIFDQFALYPEISDEQLDYPVVYASARQGWTVGSLEGVKEAIAGSAAGAGSSSSSGASATAASTTGGGGHSMHHLLSTIVSHLPSPTVLGGAEAPFRMSVNLMDVEAFLGKTVIGRIQSGRVKPGDALVCLSREGVKSEEGAKVTKLFGRRGMVRIPLGGASAGELVEIAGLQTPIPSSTLASPGVTVPLFAPALDPPTIAMSFSVNDSPLGGKEGTLLTSSAISQRLAKEAVTNVALEINIGGGGGQEGMSEAVEVRARGELQLAVLIETMRREGFELSVSPPSVLLRTEKDATTGQAVRQEPYELLMVDVGEEHSGVVIERCAERKAELKEFVQIGGGKVRLEFMAPSRGLIGLQSELKTETRGTAVLNRRFLEYGPYLLELERKGRGVMVSATDGTITAYALRDLEPRGSLFVTPGTHTYTGHIIGECSKDDRDMDINPVKAKKLTNIRAAGMDEAIRLTPPRQFSLEDALCYCAPDELVEITPTAIRLRKRILDPDERGRRARSLNKKLQALDAKN